MEGTIDPRRKEDEGPFSEYTGYSSGRSTRHVIEVSAITTRADPIYVDITPSNSSEHLLLGRSTKEPAVYIKAKELHPNMKELSWPSGGTHYCAYASISKPEAGQPVQLGLTLLGLDPYLKFVVIVDEDVDVASDRQVLWAVATRVQPARDINIIREAFCNRLDPSAAAEGITSKMIVDATAKGDFEAHRVELDAESMAKARATIAEMEH